MPSTHSPSGCSQASSKELYFVTFQWTKCNCKNESYFFDMVHRKRTSPGKLFPLIVCSEPWSSFAPQWEWNCSSWYFPSKGPPKRTAFFFLVRRLHIVSVLPTWIVAIDLYFPSAAGVADFLGVFGNIFPNEFLERKIGATVVGVYVYGTLPVAFGQRVPFGPGRWSYENCTCR